MRQLLSPAETLIKSKEMKTPFKNMHQTIQSQRKRKCEPELYSMFTQFTLFIVFIDKNTLPYILFMQML